MWREIKGHVAVYERLLATQTEDITQEFYRTEPERFSVRKSNCMLHYNEPCNIISNESTSYPDKRKQNDLVGWLVELKTVYSTTLMKGSPTFCVSSRVTKFHSIKNK